MTTISAMDWDWTAVKRVTALGEPLLELQPAGNEIAVAFGGDVANGTVCLARLLGKPPHVISLVTALGNSSYSAWLRTRLGSEGIRVIEPASTGEPGIYGIPLGAKYDATFSYWRSTSAARDFFGRAQLQDFEQLLGQPDALLITGITLALCSDSSFEALLQWTRLHGGKCRIVFDSNFRRPLWTSEAEARRRISALEQVSSLIATGLEDEKFLWGANGIADITDRLARLSCEYVVRGGKDGCWAGFGKQWDHIPSTAVVALHAVGAGDAHLAGYTAARISGCNRAYAARFANGVAAVVVSQQGSALIKGAPLPSLPTQ